MDRDRPSDPHAYVGRLERPPRIFTVGRRRADRWIVRLAFFSFFCLVLFTVWTSAEQWIRQRDLQRQEQELLCFAIATQTYEIAVGDLLLSVRYQNEDDPEVAAAKARLARVQEELRMARDAQVKEAEACPGE